MLISAIIVSYVGFVKAGGSPLGPRYTNIELSDIILPEDISKIHHVSYNRIINNSFFSNPEILPKSEFDNISDKYSNHTYTKIFNKSSDSNTYHAYAFKDINNNTLFQITDLNDQNVIMISYGDETGLYRIS